MNRTIITITDEGTITVPDNPTKIRMTITEIANLLGVFYPTVKRHIRSIKQSGIAGGDYKMACIVGSNGVSPEYYGIEMIVALAFRIKSWQANKLRRWIIERATQVTATIPLPIVLWEMPQTDAMPN
jgi:hypothetical protein